MTGPRAAKYFALVLAVLPFAADAGRAGTVFGTVAVVLFGFVSLSRLKLNLLPDLSYPTLTVRTDLPGAAPDEPQLINLRAAREVADRRAIRSALARTENNISGADADSRRPEVKGP